MLALAGPGRVFTVKVQSQAQNVVLVALKPQPAEATTSYSSRDVRQVLSRPHISATLNGCLGIDDAALNVQNWFPSVLQSFFDFLSTSMLSSPCHPRLQMSAASLDSRPTFDQFASQAAAHAGAAAGFAFDAATELTETFRIVVEDGNFVERRL